MRFVSFKNTTGVLTILLTWSRTQLLIPVSWPLFLCFWCCLIRECMCTKNYIEVEESKRVLKTSITYFSINALDTDWRNISHGRRSVCWFIARARSTVASEHVQPVREYHFIRDTYITSFAKFSRRAGQTKPFDTLWLAICTICSAWR